MEAVNLKRWRHLTHPMLQIYFPVHGIVSGDFLLRGKAIQLLNNILALMGLIVKYSFCGIIAKFFKF